MSSDPRLEELLAKREIEELIQRYSRTLDWLDDEGQAGCYWPDAAIDYGFFKGTAKDFVPVVMGVERATTRRWHLLTGLSIKLHSETSASGECYGIATGAKQDEDGTWNGNMYGGRYLDEFERREHDGTAQWRISKRQYIMDWSVPLTNQPSEVPANPRFPLPILKITESGHPLYRPM